MGRVGPRVKAPHELTSREEEVLALVRLGLTNDEIADRLGISRDGVKYHVSEILSKLEVGTREEAANWRPKPQWWAAIWPAVGPVTALKATGVTLSVAALAGMGVLLWSVADNEMSEPLGTGTLTLGDETYDFAVTECSYLDSSSGSERRTSIPTDRFTLRGVTEYATGTTLTIGVETRRSDRYIDLFKGTDRSGSTFHWVATNTDPDWMARSDDHDYGLDVIVTIDGQNVHGAGDFDDFATIDEEESVEGTLEATCSEGLQP